MGVLHSFCVYYDRNTEINDIERRALENAKTTELQIEFLEKKPVCSTDNWCENVINFSTTNLEDKLNMTIVYFLQNNKNNNTKEIRLEAYYSDAIKWIDKYGFERFMEDLKTIFEADRIEYCVL